MADTCSICIDSLHDGRPLINFCNGQDEHGNGWSHIFHVECIQGWINSPIHVGGITCPLCRRLIQVQDIQNIPVHLWKPMEIVLDGSQIIVIGSLVRNFYIMIQQWFQYQTAETLHDIALRSYVNAQQRIQNAIVTGSEINSLTNDSVMFRIQERTSSILADLNIQEMQENSYIMISLLILLLVIGKIRNPQGQRGGSSMSLSINGVSIQVPEGFECTLQEAFSSLKKGLVNTNGKKGGRKTRRRRI